MKRCFLLTFGLLILVSCTTNVHTATISTNACSEPPCEPTALRTSASLNSVINLVENVTWFEARRLCVLATYRLFSRHDILDEFFNNLPENRLRGGSLFWTGGYYDATTNGIRWNNKPFDDQWELLCPEMKSLDQIVMFAEVFSRIKPIRESKSLVPLVWDTNQITDDQPYGCLKFYIEDVFTSGSSVLPALCHNY